MIPWPLWALVIFAPIVSYGRDIYPWIMHQLSEPEDRRSVGDRPEYLREREKYIARTILPTYQTLGARRALCLECMGMGWCYDSEYDGTSMEYCGPTCPHCNGTGYEP